MLLEFDSSFTMQDGSKTFLGHEPDNTLSEFFMKIDRLGSKYAKPDKGTYNNLVFNPMPNRLTANAVKDFGIKTFPHFGSYGFYTPKYKPTSIVVIPINRKKNLEAMPTVTIQDTGTTIHLDISGDYECYRIEVRLGYFATEFITYDTSFDFIPMYTGTCTITVTGFSNEISIVSESFECTMELTDRTGV